MWWITALVILSQWAGFGRDIIELAEWRKKVDMSDPMMAAVSGHEPCSKIGSDILSRRDNAADAAIAMAVCIGTIAPYHSGIGGGGMMLVLRGKEMATIDFRETAPAASTQDMFEGNETSGQIGGLAVGVPGEVAGLQYLYDLLGSKDEEKLTTWKDLWEPSVRLAEEGWEMTEDMLYYYNNVKPSNNFLYEAPWSYDFTPTGSLPKPGEKMNRLAYANTLRTIAQRGSRAFYEGPIAESIVQTVKRAGGILTDIDLQDYKAELRRPIGVPYRNHTLFTTGAPSSGISVLSALRIMEGYAPMNKTNRNETTHTLVEAIKHTYGMRTKLGDPGFEGDVLMDMINMVDPVNTNLIRAKIKQNQTFPNEEFYNPQKLNTRDTHGTAHIAAADSRGMVVALTTTINMYFGAQIMDPKTGIILNNEMNDFNNPSAKWEEAAGASDTHQKKPSPANFIKPGKRPLSSMSPLIALKQNGQFAFSIGAAGGAKIITSVLQTCINLIDRNMTMYNAIKEPRLHHQLTPGELQLETSFDPQVAAYLKERGHEVEWVPEGRSVVQGIGLARNRTLMPACDPRKGEKGAWIVDRKNNTRVIDHPLREDWDTPPPVNLPAGGDNYTIPFNTSAIRDKH